ncbi:MAG: amino acid ABC transporter permease [Salibaculum sp.]|uniref:amino acid ABC transporter permease n=1 Tax=Roseovarius halophilus (ex Wu et al. 2025) TaxID=3376060 RepID=UPI00286FBE85|nr:amino acid ABC transporter permease [Salibaculum sp.]MDR9428085.1 amino acid ABC transporter permease [Salibaculum sp.]MDR9482418.1 amino acid ABC transporter permease [Salibaculum sp.]
MSEVHAETTRFVRTEMVAQQAPPITEKGAVKWVRENLFSGWLNVLLTVVSLFVIYAVLSALLPWFANSVWTADSLDGCREVLAEKGLSGHGGACFSVITERWNQLIFGFYPPELYWRPILAFVVFLLGIAPVLFQGTPRRALWGSIAAPFIVYWLIWGGSLWGPILTAAGFGVGAASFILAARLAGNIPGVLAAILLPVLYWMFLVGPLVSGFAAILPLEITKIESNDIGGFMLALIIGISGIILSLPLGILLALGRQSHLFIITKVSVAFIEVIRGVPLIVWLFTASLLLNYFLPPGTDFDLMLRVIIMVTLFASAYIAEVVRGGLAALPKGQYEAADALGLDYAKSMRLIILPQALKISIPGIVNTFIGLFKDTTLVVFIGLLDPIGLTNAIRSTTAWNGIYWELFIFIGLMFFIFCYSMGRYSIYLEKKLQREHR